jgi:hypothetical protein
MERSLFLLLQRPLALLRLLLLLKLRHQLALLLLLRRPSSQPSDIEQVNSEKEKQEERQGPTEDRA